MQTIKLIFFLTTIIMTSTEAINGTDLECNPECNLTSFSPPTHLCPTNKFTNRQFTFEVTKYPPLGTYFTPAGVPIHGYEAIYKKKGAMVTVWIEASTTDDDLPIYCIRAVHPDKTMKGEEVKRSTVSTQAVMEAFGVNGLDLLANGTRLSGPKHMCLSGTNTKDRNKTLNDVFTVIKAGPKKRNASSSSSSSDSSKAVAHAIKQCKTSLDALPSKERKKDAAFKLLKYLTGT
jgi:hypothetical protein